MPALLLAASVVQPLISGSVSAPVEPGQESPAELEAEALYNAGVKRFEAGDYEGAVRALEASLAKQDDANTRYAYAQTLNKMGRCPEAVREYARVIELVPADSAPHEMVDAAIRHCADQMARTLSESTAAVETETETDAPEPVLVKLPAPRPVTFGDDPGKPWRIGGIATMSAGGVGIVVGITMSALYRVRGNEFSSNLKNSVNESEVNGCSLSVATDECPRIEGEIDTWRSNGNQANQLSAVSLGIGVGLGAVVLVAGGLVFREGKLRTRQWRNGMPAARVVPTRRGVSVVGRF